MGAKFPDARHTAVAGFLFLRFLCPAIVAPESHGGRDFQTPPCITADGSGFVSGVIGKKSVSRDVRRSLTLVAKVLQQLGNGVEFGKKEEVRLDERGAFFCTFVSHPWTQFMAPFNEFVLDELISVQCFLESATDESAGTELGMSTVTIPRAVTERSIGAASRTPHGFL